MIDSRATKVPPIARPVNRTEAENDQTSVLQEALKLGAGLRINKNVVTFKINFATRMNGSRP